jgi:4-amino-4-deoxy-L-arabinose transferase-like glycosyltransferase
MSVGTSPRSSVDAGAKAAETAAWHNKHRAWLAVAALTLVALVLRFIGANGELWLDEMYASILSFRRSFFGLLTVYEGDNQHPLYSLLAHLGIVLFGETPLAIRLPAVLFGAASVPLLYVLGARLASRREGLLAAALLTVSYHHVWFSQNARGYTMLAFWTMLTTYLLFRGIREGSVGKLVAYGVVAALGIYTHLTMIFLVAAHVLICLWLIMPWARPRLHWRLPVYGFAAGAAATLLLYAPLISEVLNFFLNRPSRLLGVSTPGWALEEGLRVLRLGLRGGWPVMAGGLVFVAGLLSYLRRSPLIAALFVLPGVTTVAGALMGRGTMYPRFFFFLIGFALLIVVRGALVFAELAAAAVSRGQPRARLAHALGVALVGLMLIASASSLRYNYAYPKQAFQSAAAYVADHAQADDRVGVLNASWYAYMEYYHKPWTRLTFRDDPADDPAANLARLRAGRRVFLVYTFPRYIAHEAPAITRVIETECGAAAKFDSTVGDGDVYVCALPPLPGERRDADS